MTAATTTQKPGTPGRRWRPRLSVAPLRHRGYRMLFAGQTVSLFGDAFGAVALPWLVYRLGGGARQLGLVVAVYGLCRLATTPLGGMLADRLGAWRVMMVSDAGRLALSGGLAAVAFTGAGGTGALAALAGGTGLLAGLFLPAAYTITPSVLPDDDLAAGNALSGTAAYAAGLVGPALAGCLIVLFDPGVAFVVDGATFAVSALCLAAIGHTIHRPGTTHHPDDATAGEPAASVGASGGRGGLWRVLVGSRLLRGFLVVTAVANLTVGGMMRVGLPALSSGALRAGPGGLGTLLAAFSAGCLGGGLLTALLTGLVRRGAAAMVSGLVMAVAVAVAPFGGLVGAAVALFVAGATSTGTNILVITLIQQEVPRALLGRVMGVLTFVGLGLFPVSVAVTGLVTARWGATAIFVVTGALLAAGFLSGLAQPAIRRR
jgi:hypothetical protein